MPTEDDGSIQKNPYGSPGKGKRETPPIDLYMEALAVQRGGVTAQHRVTRDIEENVEKTWKAARRIDGTRRRGRPARRIDKPPTGFSRLRDRAKELAEERAATGRTAAYRELTDSWRERWQQESNKPCRSAVTWLDD